jgi:hypothetical protein
MRTRDGNGSPCGELACHGRRTKVNPDKVRGELFVCHAMAARPLRGYNGQPEGPTKKN